MIRRTIFKSGTSVYQKAPGTAKLLISRLHEEFLQISKKPGTSTGTFQKRVFKWHTDSSLSWETPVKTARNQNDKQLKLS